VRIGAPTWPSAANPTAAPPLDGASQVRACEELATPRVIKGALAPAPVVARTDRLIGHPRLQALPLADERLVRDVDAGVLAEGLIMRKEIHTLPGERLDDWGELLPRAIGGHCDLAEPHRAAGVSPADLGTATLGDESEEDLGELALLGRQRFENRVGVFGESARDAAGFTEVLARDDRRARGSPHRRLPHPRQDVLEERQLVGNVRDLVDQLVGELGFDVTAEDLGRRGDRRRELFAVEARGGYWQRLMASGSSRNLTQSPRKSVRMVSAM
jgi:hypothetical protein